MQTVFTEGRHAAEFIMSEANGNRARENVTIAAEQTIAVGALLTAVLEAASAAKAGGNTGDGTFVLDAEAPLRADAVPGVYRLRCIAAATNSGTFRLHAPDGSVLVDVTISGGAGGNAALNDQIKGVVTDGAADFAVGDGFDITVTDTGERVAFAVGDVPAGIAIYPATTGEAETAAISAIVRAATVNGNILSWPAGITSGQKAAAAALLEKRGIIVR